MRMSLNPLFGSKKRSSTMLFGAGQSSSLTTSSSRSDSRRDGLPPNKRYKNAESTKCVVQEDPFGENEDFTVDDLEELDILATQALIEDEQMVVPDQSTIPTEPSQISRPIQSSTVQKPRNSNSWNSVVGGGRVPKDPIGNGTGSVMGNDNFGLEALQVQHEELKKKLKELHDYILVKNGEIKVLRDSLRQSEEDQERQRRLHLQLQNERVQAQSEKEKELAKKLQCLQSELQFKDAEMNEIRARFQNCERLSKSTTAATPCVSPKKSPSGNAKTDSSSSTQSGKNSFPTKESFGAEMSPKSSTSLVLQTNQKLFSKEDNKLQFLGPKPEKIHEPISYTDVQKQNTQGSILLNALMKPSLAPGSLGLYHLLSNSPEPLPVAILQHSVFNRESTGMSSSIATGSKDDSPAPDSSLREAQRLAITGLNLIAVDDGQSKDDLADKQNFLFSLSYLCKLPGAVHLLPLVEYHITTYCEALQTMEKSGKSPSDNEPLSSSSTAKSISSSLDNLLFSLEDFTIASLGVLYYLVFYSQEVVCTLLHYIGKGGFITDEPETEKGDHKPSCSYHCNNEPRTSRPQQGMSEDQSQHPLFKKILQILAFPTTTPGCQRARIVNQSLNVLVKLAENSTPELLGSFQSFLLSPLVLKCLCLEVPVSAAHLTVRLLAVFAEHEHLASQLCSSSETCMLLAMYTYVTVRPDKLASEKLWLLFEEEIVQFLMRMCSQCLGPYSTYGDSTCQCNHEVVKALVIMLHRQWLKVKRPENNLCRLQNKVIQFLRNTLLLMHTISQKDKAFHEHCVEVLHQYDQALPGIRAICRKLPDLTESEAAALEDLCPPEPEMDEEDMDCS